MYFYINKDVVHLIISQLTSPFCIVCKVCCTAHFNIPYRKTGSVMYTYFGKEYRNGQYYSTLVWVQHTLMMMYMIIKITIVCVHWKTIIMYLVKCTCKMFMNRNIEMYMNKNIVHLHQ